MPGAPEFLQQVGGGSGQPLTTNASGTVETDNYSEGGVINQAAGSLPVTIDPDEWIQEIQIYDAGPNVKFDIITKTGTTINDVTPNGAVWTQDKLEIDEITIKDGGAGESCHGIWVGE